MIRRIGLFFTKIDFLISLSMVRWDSYSITFPIHSSPMLIFFLTFRGCSFSYNIIYFFMLAIFVVVVQASFLNNNSLPIKQNAYYIYVSNVPQYELKLYYGHLLELLLLIIALSDFIRAIISFLSSNKWLSF